MLKIWRLVNNVNKGCNTFDSIVVIADTEKEARHITPNDATPELHPRQGTFGNEWCSPEQLEVSYIGTTDRKLPCRVICASYNGC
jgi:hypothetical protein